MMDAARFELYKLKFIYLLVACKLICDISSLLFYLLMINLDCML